MSILSRLDARIDRCPECDGWRFDKHCHECTRAVDENPAGIAQVVDFPVHRNGAA